MWTSWKIQQLLIVSHKHNIKQIAEGFPKDVEMYRKTWYINNALQKAINNLTMANIFIWVKSKDGNVLTQSVSLQNYTDYFI